MNKNSNLLVVIVLVGVMWFFTACSPSKGDYTGSEYMPDMAHSIAYEANTYSEYWYNTWTEADGSVVSRKAMSMPRLPVEGTVPRGYAGAFYAKNKAQKEVSMSEMLGAKYLNTKSIPMSGSVPYYYGNTEDERTRAMNELLYNPVPITASGLKEGKVLYNTYCGICHGEKGDGNGYLVADENPNVKYANQPTIFTQDELIDASNGRYYHTIMHGRNVMGSYKDKLSYEERWNVIHYIRSLQAKERKAEYNNLENTLNAYAKPGGPDFKNDPFAKQVKSMITSKGHDSHHGGSHKSDDSRTLRLDNVFFKTGSAELDGKSRAELLKLAYILKAYPEVAIEVSGHTDNVGDPEMNLNLSKARAESVRNFLIGQEIAGERMQSAGYGETKPVSGNDTAEGRAENRRTEFTLL